MKVVINTCYGGFGISEAAYERLIELGIPLRDYIKQSRGADGRYLPEPANDGEVIFRQTEYKSLGKYWDSFLGENRQHPLLIQVIEELGSKANGHCASLKVIDLPDGTDFEISEYDGNEHIAERHRTWG